MWVCHAEKHGDLLSSQGVVITNHPTAQSKVITFCDIDRT